MLVMGSKWHALAPCVIPPLFASPPRGRAPTRRGGERSSPRSPTSGVLSFGLCPTGRDHCDYGAPSTRAVALPFRWREEQSTQA